MENHDFMARGSKDENNHSIKGKHAIFLSHSGAQKSFVEQLCVDIERCDRTPFFDRRRESLPIGEHFPNLIFQAIEECRIGVVVLSKEFFTRTKWPMMELVALVEAQKENKNLVIIPVFFGISRSDVRNIAQQEDWHQVWNHWATSEKRINIAQWMLAMEIFGPINGLSLTNEGEVKLREKIVEEICRRVPPDSRWNVSHVQGRDRLFKVLYDKIEINEMHRIDEVRLVGLYGMGGLGKSTMCKLVCSKLFGDFFGRVCHIELESGSELELLQEALKRLTDTNHNVVETFNTDQCKVRLEKIMHEQKVFLAIDNVTDNSKSIEQALTFLRARKKEGSVVIVTARTLQQLRNLRIPDIDCHEVPKLEVDEARSLFLYNAIYDEYGHLSKKRKRNEQDEEVIGRCVERCHFSKGNGASFHYHPLALKVLGVQLMGVAIEKWQAQLEELDTFNRWGELEHPIFSILRKSFDALKYEDKVLYLDVALFLPEMDQPSLNMMNWLCAVHGVSEHVIRNKLENLKTKSLVEEVGDGSVKIGLHDLWQEFCVIETRGEGQDLKRWIYEKKIFPISSEDLSMLDGSWNSLERLCLTTNDHQGFDLKGFDINGCSNLKVVKLVDINLKFEVLDLSILKGLRSLEVKRLYSRNLIGFSKVKIHGLELLGNLRVLILDPIPEADVACLEALGRLTKLQILRLVLSYGSEYRSFPDISMLSWLRSVWIEGFDRSAFKLVFSSQMTNLRYLSIRNCLGLTSCHGLEDLVGLVELDLRDCKNLGKLPILQKLTVLREINLEDCHLIEELPDLVEELPVLVASTRASNTAREVLSLSKSINSFKLDAALKSPPSKYSSRPPNLRMSGNSPSFQQCCALSTFKATKSPKPPL